MYCIIPGIKADIVKRCITIDCMKLFALFSYKPLCTAITIQISFTLNFRPVQLSLQQCYLQWTQFACYIIIHLVATKKYVTQFQKLNTNF